MTNAFDELARLLTPERLLLDPRATGEGVEIAIIDSGIDRLRLNEKFQLLGQEIHPITGAVFGPGDGEPSADLGQPSSPHGTTVADVVLTLAPRARLYSADVFGPRGRCDVTAVVRALRWSIERWKCKVVNLSLGIAEHDDLPSSRRQQLQRAVEDAYFQDVVVIAAAHNDHPFSRSYPAGFAPPLLSVDKYLFASPLTFEYRLREGIEFRAHSRGYLGPFASEPATSWAAPHLTGIAARLLSLRPQLKPFEIKTLLYWLSQKPTGQPDG
jgi:hypothetical protein